MVSISYSLGQTAPSVGFRNQHVYWVQKAEGKATTTTNTYTTPAFANALGERNLVVCSVLYNNVGTSTLTGVSDSAGNTYTQVPGIGKYVPADRNTLAHEIWYKENATGGSGVTVTGTWNANNSTRQISCHEYRGTFVTGALNASCTGTGNATGLRTICNITTTNRKEFVFAYITSAWTATYYSAGGWSSRSTISNEVMQDKNFLESGTYAVQATINVSGAHGGVAASFRYR